MLWTIFIPSVPNAGVTVCRHCSVHTYMYMNLIAPMPDARRLHFPNSKCSLLSWIFNLPFDYVQWFCLVNDFLALPLPIAYYMNPLSHFIYQFVYPQSVVQQCNDVQHTQMFMLPISFVFGSFFSASLSLFLHVLPIVHSIHFPSCRFKPVFRLFTTYHCNSLCWPVNLFNIQLLLHELQ